MTVPIDLRVGVLALQGGFAEHASHLGQASRSLPPSVRTTISLIRTPKELESCDALIIPGGESTTITLLAGKIGLLEPLKSFAKSKPIWGSCAGMICLSEEIHNEDEQNEFASKSALRSVGGLDISIVRNQYGRQLASFEHPLQFAGIRDANVPFPGVFIRAPIIHRLFAQNANRTAIEVLSTIPADLLPEPSTAGKELGPDARVVAIKQGNVLATSFHPELSHDTRVHEYFLTTVVLPYVMSA